MEDGQGAENLDQLQRGMWMVALPNRGYHTVPLKLLTGWLTRLFVVCDGFCGLFCS